MLKCAYQVSVTCLKDVESHVISSLYLIQTFNVVYSVSLRLLFQKRV